uniref:RNase H type-1 domain-containing protein n=1 Tax=Arion vulgaris TaxID=1028688 RepID=A0A0B6ZWI7_9EUPU
MILFIVISLYEDFHILALLTCPYVFSSLPLQIQQRPYMPVRYRLINQCSLAAGETRTNFPADATALLAAVQILNNQQVSTKNITVFSDSRSFLQTILCPRQDKLIHDVKHKISLLSQKSE